jgi:uncharacterized protein (TIGR03067 family)
MKWYTPVFLAAGLALTTTGLPGASVKEEKKQLKGAWKLVSVTEDGKPVLSKTLKKRKAIAIFRGKHMLGWMDNQLVNDSVYKVDPSQNPKAIDITDTRGKYRGKKQHGIYEIEGNTLKISYCRPGKKRPAEFDTKDGSGCTVEVYKRVQSRKRR